MDGLIIRKEPLDLILAGRKSWEMRSRRTSKRGLIALIEKGSGQAVGVAELIDVQGPLDAHDWRRARHLHRSGGSFGQAAASGYLVAWVLQRAERLPRPVSYRHPSGAVTWVRLPPAVASRIRQQMASGRSIAGPAPGRRARIMGAWPHQGGGERE